MTSSVRAARLIAHGQPLVVDEVELPEPGPDEVRVDLSFAGVNPVDRYMAEGSVSPDGPLPRTIGGEGSGTVDGRVVLVTGEGLGARRDGVWAEAAVVPRAAVFDVPPGTDPQVVATMGVAGLTAWDVVKLAEVGTTDRVLVLGAAGGVGLTVVGLARASGADVWGQTGSAAKAAAIVTQGAAHVVVADARGLTDAVRAFQPTVVIDALGDGYTAAALAAMSPHGRLVIFGTSAGDVAELRLRHVYRNGLRILGYASLLLASEQRRAGLAEALEALALDRLRVPIGRVMALAEVNEAFRLLGERAVTGKIVVSCK